MAIRHGSSNVKMKVKSADLRTTEPTVPRSVKRYWPGLYWLSSVEVNFKEPVYGSKVTAGAVHVTRESGPETEMHSYVMPHTSGGFTMKASVISKITPLSVYS